MVFQTFTPKYGTSTSIKALKGKKKTSTRGEIRLKGYSPWYFQIPLSLHLKTQNNWVLDKGKQSRQNTVFTIFFNLAGGLDIRIKDTMAETTVSHKDYRNVSEGQQCFTFCFFRRFFKLSRNKLQINRPNACIIPSTSQ